MMQINKSFLFISITVISLFIVFGGVTYTKELKQLRREKKQIDSLYQTTLKEYIPAKDYLFKLDSLNKEIEILKTYNDAKIRYIYINSSFDDKYKLLTERIQNDSI